MGKVVDLCDNEIEAVDFLDDDFVEVASKIGVVEALGKELREGLNRNQADSVLRATCLLPSRSKKPLYPATLVFDEAIPLGSYLG
jgi:hypothetical protein